MCTTLHTLTNALHDFHFAPRDALAVSIVLLNSSAKVAVGGRQCSETI
jgi:hypothetical protein